VLSALTCLGLVFLAAVCVVVVVVALGSKRTDRPDSASPATLTKPVPAPTASYAALPPPGNAPSSRSGIAAVRPSAAFPPATPVVAIAASRSTVVTSGKQSARWYAPKESVTVGGYVLSDGMVYVGQALSSVANDYRSEPSLINPSLEVDANAPDHEGAGMSYWPSYETISPACRAGYLSWLSTGRSSANAYIGYVFLFFYGIERRVLHAAVGSPEVHAEVPSLCAEVKRLLGIYGRNNSFRRYASEFLEVVIHLHPSSPHAATTGGQGGARRAAASLAAQSRPLNVDVALAWVREDIDMPLRTPAKRCGTEFDALFRQRYVARFGDGLPLRACKTKLTSEYRPASASFGGSIRAASDLPDVWSLVSPRREIAALAEECCDDLESLSRWKGPRGEHGDDDLNAVALLPVELLGTNAPNSFVELKRKISAQLDGQARMVANAENVLEPWLPADGSTLAKKDAVQAALILERAGFALEPDVRFGGKRLSRGDQIVLYRCGAAPTAAPTREYERAALGLHVAAVLAWADDAISETERRTLEEQVRRTPDLTAAERDRLAAHLTWLLAEPRAFEGLKKRIESLAAGQRAEIAAFVVQVVLADGQAGPDEIKSLQRLYRLLGLDPGSAHTTIHSLQAGETDRTAPVTVYAPASQERGFAIPPPTPPAVGRATKRTRGLDLAAVQSKLAESAKVAELLAGIFVEEEPAQVPFATAASTDSVVGGLDAAHSRIFARLRLRASWPLAEFEALTRSFQLMPQGALDTINEAVIEKCGVALTEGDDPLTIDTTVYAEFENA